MKSEESVEVNLFEIVVKRYFKSKYKYSGQLKPYRRDNNEQG